MTGDLQALTRRGWHVYAEYEPLYTGNHFIQLEADHENDGTPMADVLHPDRETCVRMAVAACLVAEGHDLLRLLNEAYQALPEDAWYLREEILRALMGTSVPPVCAGAGKPGRPDGPEADAAALDTTASAGTQEEAA